MAGPVMADRVKETSTTTGTGTLNLAGAVSGYQNFVAGVATGNSCYYAIVNRDAAEWEVGIGTVTDASPDTLSRTTVMASSNAGALVNFSAGTKDVFVTIPADVANKISGLNLLLNPSFETVLYGSHTTEITTHNGVSTVKNTQFPGWQGVTPGGSPSMSVTAVAATVNGKQACQVASVTLGTSNAALLLEQRWNATHAPLDIHAATCRGLIIGFAMDVTLSSATASACRIGVSIDGGSNYTYSAYHTAAATKERLFVSVDATANTTLTDVRFRLSIESATPTYTFDNGMVLTTTVTLTAIPFAHRPPISLLSASQLNAGSWDLVWTTPTATGTAYKTNSAEPDTNFSINAARPHWANNIEAQFYITGGIAADEFYIFPGSAASYDCRLMMPIVAGSVLYQRILEIGIDGQDYISISNLNLDAYMAVNRWIGVGL